MMNKKKSGSSGVSMLLVLVAGWLMSGSQVKNLEAAADMTVEAPIVAGVAVVLLCVFRSESDVSASVAFLPRLPDCRRHNYCYPVAVCWLRRWMSWPSVFAAWWARRCVLCWGVVEVIVWSPWKLLDVGGRCYTCGQFWFWSPRCRRGKSSPGRVLSGVRKTGRWFLHFAALLRETRWCWTLCWMPGWVSTRWPGPCMRKLTPLGWAVCWQ